MARPAPVRSKNWEQAKREARVAIYATAQRQGLITYSELVGHIGSMRFDPHEQELARLLGEISTEDDEKEMGLSSVVVVRKGDPTPGPGFYNMAANRGRDVTDEIACWTVELKKVHLYWRKRR